MNDTHRFGKRIPLPSTLQIRTELKALAAQDAASAIAADIAFRAKAVVQPADDIARPTHP